MEGTLFRIGGVGVSVYGLFLLAGFGAGLLRLVRSAGRAGLTQAEALDLGLYLLLAGLVGARLGHVLAHAGAYLADPLRAVLIWQDGGLAFYGGVAACVVACRTLRPDRWVAVLDAVAAPAAAGYALGVLGALWGGLFLGRPTDLPWAVDVAGALRHPVAAYLALASVGAYRVLEAMARVEHLPGQLTLTYLVLHGTARTAADLFVDPNATSAVVGPLTLGQLSAGVVAAAAGAGLWALGRARAGQSEGGPPPR
ncbi:MAG: prolipoprotein diacylglyceryl transferase [Armatimonadota bacterium]|nr:prolipoprotein diacylglyceryl transferase [Armatimonadota bacterium]MDR5676501.1 prolipoprotein diacylglyceryl transferase [Armatimonadota bacterium]MDR7387174.1 prolipoprotein diacylglyceryl transferase [Armatimonadota bacterium]MDR7389191.1 prolipoprotein diacylglyceryl transferase [Armatimonadota bacterium]MDR7393428.1 prolipoprotein diacylglyceryl transferase [Armatimonadota bacterium]